MEGDFLAVHRHPVVLQGEVETAQFLLVYLGLAMPIGEDRLVRHVVQVEEVMAPKYSVVQDD